MTKGIVAVMASKLPLERLKDFCSDEKERGHVKEILHKSVVRRGK